jgi:hypothetical protein
MRNIILLAAVVLMGVMGGNTLSAQKFGYIPPIKESKITAVILIGDL